MGGISGVVATPKENITLSEIANESVVSVNVVCNNDKQGLIGTAFLYKQIIRENTATLFFLTNLHVICSAFFDGIYRCLYSDIVARKNQDCSDINPHITLRWQEGKGKKRSQDLNISKVYIPKGLFYKNGTDEFFQHDFAIIVCEEIETVETFKFFGMKKNYDIKQNDKIYAWGYPVGLALTASDGIVGHVYDDSISILKIEDTIFKIKNTIQHNILINHGNSGGPTIAENGLIVGISMWGLPINVAAGINFSLRTDSVMEFIKDGGNMELLDINALIDATKKDLLAKARVR